MSAIGEDEAGEDGEAEAAAAAAEPVVPVPPAPRESDFLSAAAPLPDVPTTREIASAMRAIAPAARECARELPAQTVYVTVAITGKSGRAARVEVPELDGSAQRCLIDAVRSATFPRFERAELELRFPFLLGQ